MHVGPHDDVGRDRQAAPSLGGSLGRPTRRPERGRRESSRAKSAAPSRLRHPTAAARSRFQGFGNVGSISAQADRRDRPARSSPSSTGRGGVLQTPTASTSRSCSRTRAQTKTVAGLQPAASRSRTKSSSSSRVEILISGGARKSESGWTTRRRFAPKGGHRGRQRPDDAPNAHKPPVRARACSWSPDILANSAGVTTSYFRVGAGSLRATSGPRSRSNERLEAKMCESLQRRAADGEEIQGRHAHRGVHGGHRARVALGHALCAACTRRVRRRRSLVLGDLVSWSVPGPWSVLGPPLRRPGARIARETCQRRDGSVRRDQGPQDQETD